MGRYLAKRQQSQLVAEDMNPGLPMLLAIKFTPRQKAESWDLFLTQEYLVDPRLSKSQIFGEPFIILMNIYGLLNTLLSCICLPMERLCWGLAFA